MRFDLTTEDVPERDLFALWNAKGPTLATS